MTSCVRKSSLPEAQQRLIEVMQRLNYGRISSLQVEGGQPVLIPPPRIVREVKLSGENGERPEAVLDDFVLKTQHIAMLQQFEELGHGTFDLIEVKAGLPFKLEVSLTV